MQHNTLSTDCLYQCPHSPLPLSPCHCLAMGDGSQNHRTGSPSRPLYSRQGAGSKGAAEVERLPHSLLSTSPQQEQRQEESHERPKNELLNVLMFFTRGHVLSGYGYETMVPLQRTQRQVSLFGGEKCSYSSKCTPETKIIVSAQLKLQPKKKSFSEGKKKRKSLTAITAITRSSPGTHTPD